MSAPTQSYKGERLGLPESGPGSLAPAGPRFWALVVDVLGSALVAGLFTAATSDGSTADRLPGSWSLVPLAIDYLFGLVLAGRTVGMYLFGLRVVRVDRHARITPTQAIIRTLLLFLLVPALIWDRDGRCLHDRFSDTAVVRA